MSGAILQVDLNTLDILQYREMSNHNAAFWLTRRLRELEDIWRRGFAARGLILLEVETRELWRYVDDSDGKPFTSFNRWLIACAPHSERDCRYALAAVKELQDVPKPDLLEIPRMNLEVLKSVSTSVRSQPEVLEAAKTLSEAEFVAHLQVTQPTQHIEATKRLVLTYPAGDLSVIEAALDLVGTLSKVESREGQLLALCIDFIGEHSEAVED